MYIVFRLNTTSIMMRHEGYHLMILTSLCLVVLMSPDIGRNASTTLRGKNDKTLTMIDYCQKIDLLAELNEQLRIILHEFLTVKCSTEEERQTLLSSIDENCCKPKVIGQEKSGLFLFTWHFENCSYGKTFVASYLPTNKFSKLLLYQDKILNIINGSVNIDFTLLAFTTTEGNSYCDRNSVEVGNDSNEIYKSYVAEIMPQNRVFALDDEFCAYQKIQFLSEDPKQLSRINKHRLLFFQHKDAIKVYFISVNKCGDKVVIKQQPTTQQVVGTFMWAKFDLANQRLYFMQLMAQDEDEIDASGLVYAVEFHNNFEQCQYVLTFLLPIPLKMGMMKKQSLYYKDYLSHIISCKTFNMDILATPAGSFYVCFQHETQQDVQESSKLSDEDSDDESTQSTTSSAESSFLSSYPDSTGCYVNYTVVCLHGGYSVKVSSSFPVSVMERSLRIYFSLYNDYLVAYLPDKFIHFLDISHEHEPVHNLLIKRRELLPKLPKHMESPLFSTIIGGSGNSFILENKSLNIFQTEFNRNGVMRLFLSTKPRTRLSLIHACVNHFKDQNLTKNIMASICRDPANSDTTQMLKEYLLIVPYSQMKIMVTSPTDLKIFPFTTQSFYRGQIERDENGHRDVYLFYKQFGNNLTRQLQKVLESKEDLFWKNILIHLKFVLKHKSNRVPLKLFNMAAIDGDASKNAKAFSLARGRRNTSALTTVDDSSSDSEYSVVTFGSVSNDNALDQDVKENEYFNNVATECIVKYVTKKIGSDVKLKASKMCDEYMEKRNRTIMALWKIIVKSLNNTDESVRYKALDVQIDEHEIAIFQIVERLKVILDQLCYPRIPRLATLLTTMGLRCLTRSQFLAYTDAEIFTIDISLVRRVVRELPDTPDNISLKENLIMRLTKPEAQKILSEWNHPIGDHYFAKQLLPRLPNEIENFKTFDEAASQNQDEQFLPLETLMNAIKTQGKPFSFLRQRIDSKLHNEKMHLLSSAALAETKSLIS